MPAVPPARYAIFPVGTSTLSTKNFRDYSTYFTRSDYFNPTDVYCYLESFWSTTEGGIGSDVILGDILRSSLPSTPGDTVCPPEELLVESTSVPLLTPYADCSLGTSSCRRNPSSRISENPCWDPNLPSKLELLHHRAVR